MSADQERQDIRNSTAADIDVSSIGDEACRRIAEATELSELDALASEFLDKSSRLSQLKASMKDLEPEERKLLGARMNQTRGVIESELAQRRSTLETEEIQARLSAESLDLTEYLGQTTAGHAHVVTRTWQELEDVFCGIGYNVETGPEVETDWFNFEALNLPPSHPARSMWDTLYLDTSDLDGVSEGQLVLRTHTSPVQARTMLSRTPPIYVVCPGRVFRTDEYDATHSPVFHQVEGLVIDKGISMAHLRGALDHMLQALFGEGMRTRFRPSYFPFTEPSAEMDMVCFICHGSGQQDEGECRTCRGEGWIELGGCGIVNPRVLIACGVDPEVYSGFAFGFGIDRLLMFRHGVADMRDIFEGDTRFATPFGVEL